MNTNNLLASNTPEALVRWLMGWGVGCGDCDPLPRSARQLCTRCRGLNAFPLLSERRFRLIACALCRHVWHLLPDEARRAVLVAERFAERRATVPELQAAYSGTCSDVAGAVVLREDRQAADQTVQRVRTMLAAPLSRYQYQEFPHDRGLCDVIRDLVEDPWHPTAIDPLWLVANDGQALAVAACIDAEGRFDEIPILGDALEEAGCDDVRLLAHARQPRHYCGCWLIDSILGKQ